MRDRPRVSNTPTNTNNITSQKAILPPAFSTFASAAFSSPSAQAAKRSSNDVLWRTRRTTAATIAANIQPTTKIAAAATTFGIATPTASVNLSTMLSIRHHLSFDASANHKNSPTTIPSEYIYSRVASNKHFSAIGHAKTSNLTLSFTIHHLS